MALGVAFFSGIQAASPDMRLSGDAYYNEASLMDLKVMATLGLTEDDVKAIQSIDGVESAEGAYSTDAICGENEKQKVLHIESMNQKVNQLTVTEGRLPEKAASAFWTRRLPRIRDMRSAARSICARTGTVSFC